MNVLPFNGLTSKTKVSSPIIKGKIIISNPILGSRLSGLRSFGLAASSLNTCGLEPELIAMLINNGIAPIVFVAAIITRSIIKYLQKAFFPVNDDSRWFMNLIYQNSENVFLG
jgi:hypothetical protein